MLSGMPSLHELGLCDLNIRKSVSDILVVLKSLTQFNINTHGLQSEQAHS